MEEPGTGQDSEHREILFENRNRARLVTASLDAKADELLVALDLEPPRSVIMISGAAGSLDKKMEPRLTQLFSRGIARAAVRQNAVIVDGGTHAGVMALMGQGVADRGRQTPLIGVAPKGRVNYPGGVQIEGENAAFLDPDHTHFVLVEGSQWGDETQIMYDLGAALLKNTSVNERPRVPDQPLKEVSEPTAVVILAGSRVGGIAQKEILQAVRQRWPIIVLEGSGELPSKLKDLHQKRQTALEIIRSQSTDEQIERPPLIQDPDLAEIIIDGKLIFFPEKADASELEDMILRELYRPYSMELLESAWKRFAVYDLNAISQQKKHRRLTRAILTLGVLTTLFALLYVFLTTTEGLALDSGVETALRYLIIALPILTSLGIAFFNQLKSGSKWSMLRGSAENIKKEIYAYRALARQAPRQQLAELEREVEQVTRNLMRTDVNESALQRYTGRIPPIMDYAADKDDGYSPLAPEEYIDIRIQDQVSYFEGKTNKIENGLRTYQVIILLAGGMGTFLAAVNLQLWVPLTTAFVTALTAYLISLQYQETVVKHNQTKADLLNLIIWWEALSPVDKQDPIQIRRLVKTSEQVLIRENTGWVQLMQNALVELRENIGKQSQIDSQDQDR